jgi:hypothetical protein
MKKFISIIIILLTALMINTAAQTATDNLTVVDFQNSISYVWRGVDIDSAETVWSQWFKLSDYDGYNTVDDTTSAANVKPQVGYRFTLDAGNTTVKTNVYHYVNYVHPDSLSDWIVADTLAVITAETAGHGEVDLNNYKAPYNKLQADNLDTGQSGKLNFGIYYPKKE